MLTLYFCTILLYDCPMRPHANKPQDDVRTLAANVLKLSKLLTKDRESLPVAYLKDPELRLAYLRYYLPANMKKVHLALTDLSLHPEWLLSKPHLRVLDLGAGPGTALLGLLAFFAQRVSAAVPQLLLPSTG